MTGGDPVGSGRGSAAHLTDMPLSDTEAEAYLSIGTTSADVVRMAWPDATDAQARYVLWEYTPWPLTEGLLDLVGAVAAAREQIGPLLPEVADDFGLIGHASQMSAA